jgi:uncharacterized caspase-like protein
MPATAIGTLITFATNPDTVALDGSGRNSPFTTALLKHIRMRALEVPTMLTRVRADMIKATNEQQVPWDHSSLTGEFLLQAEFLKALTPRRQVICVCIAVFAECGRNMPLGAFR